jgi:hypothetical protein
MLQKLAVEIFLALAEFHIKLVPVWVSRDNEIIEWADQGSRDFRSDDYSLDPVTLQFLKATFGNFTLDTMANAANCICPKFYSRFSSVGTFGVNFFAQTLNRREYYYCFPPVRRSVDALRHFASFHAKGVLIIPVWPKAVSCLGSFLMVPMQPVGVPSWSGLILVLFLDRVWVLCLKAGKTG